MRCLRPTGACHFGDIPSNVFQKQIYNFHSLAQLLLIRYPLFFNGLKAKALISLPVCVCGGEGEM